MVRLDETPEESALRMLRGSPPMPIWAALVGPADKSARFTAALLTGYLGSQGATNREIAAFAHHISKFPTPAAILNEVWGPDPERG